MKTGHFTSLQILNIQTDLVSWGHPSGCRGSIHLYSLWTFDGIKSVFAFMITNFWIHLLLCWEKNETNSDWIVLLCCHRAVSEVLSCIVRAAEKMAVSSSPLSMTSTAPSHPQSPQHSASHSFFSLLPSGRRLQTLNPNPPPPPSGSGPADWGTASGTPTLSWTCPLLLLPPTLKNPTHVFPFFGFWFSFLSTWILFAFKCNSRVQANMDIMPCWHHICDFIGNLIRYWNSIESILKEWSPKIMMKKWTEENNHGEVFGGHKVTFAGKTRGSRFFHADLHWCLVLDSLVFDVWHFHSLKFLGFINPKKGGMMTSELWKSTRTHSHKMQTKTHLLQDFSERRAEWELFTHVIMIQVLSRLFHVWMKVSTVFVSICHSNILQSV